MKKDYLIIIVGLTILVLYLWIPIRPANYITGDMSLEEQQRLANLMIEIVRTLTIISTFITIGFYGAYELYHTKRRVIDK